MNGRVMVRKLVSVICLGAVVAGCKTVPCPIYPHTDPRQALAQHERARPSFTSLKAEARVEQWGDRGRIRGTVLMLLEKPDRVRFDVVTALGPVSVLTSDGERFQLSDIREGRFLEGPTCAENIAALMGISLEAGEVLRLLTGDAPKIASVSESMECRNGHYVVTRLAEDGRQQEIAFAVPDSDRGSLPEAQHLWLSRSEVFDPAGTSLWRVTYDDYEPVSSSSGQWFAHDIRFVDHRHGADTRVRVKSLSLDPIIPPDAFSQSPSGGIVPEFHPCH